MALSQKCWACYCEFVLLMEDVLEKEREKERERGREKKKEWRGQMD